MAEADTPSANAMYSNHDPSFPKSLLTEVIHSGLTLPPDRAAQSHLWWVEGEFSPRAVEGVTPTSASVVQGLPVPMPPSLQSMPSGVW